MFNKKLLSVDIQLYINNNLQSNTASLLLKGSPFNGVSVQELVSQIIAKQKAKQKLPTWFAAENIYYPPKISIEQTSSEITAVYKSNLLSGNNLIDITGGFGVDCYEFSKTFKKVTHCEINSELSKIVTHNYKQLKADTVTTIADDGLQYLKKTNETFDCIYTDPSRRNDAKGKVFLLEDCSPNIPENLDFLFTKTNSVLIKYSPMLDISYAIKELKFVKQVHVVAVNNEVKELLFLLEKSYNNDVKIKTINITKTETQKLDFVHPSNANSEYSLPLSYLYEPNAAILKSGGFHQVSKQYAVFKLHQHSHLYTSSDLIDFPGRRFKIEHILPYDKKQLKKLIPNQKANVTVRNFSKTVAQIRKETKLKDGGNVYIFCTKNQNDKNTVIICSKIV